MLCIFMHLYLISIYFFLKNVNNLKKTEIKFTNYFIFVIQNLNAIYLIIMIKGVEWKTSMRFILHLSR